jgi:MSHA pilin protein MshA
MQAKQTGFTLIELVMVIVILGVLAAVAIPKFVDLGSDARDAAAQGVAGGLSSASAMNYSVRKVRGATADSVAITNCQHAANALQGGLPTGYTIDPVAIAADVTKVDCKLNPPTGAQVNFTATGIL